MKPPRSRFRRVAKWVGLVVCAIPAALWLNQAPPVSWVSPESRWLILFMKGTLSIEIFTPRFVESLPLRPGFRIGGFSGGVRSHWPFVGGDADATQILIPLWLTVLALAIPTAFLWYRDRRPPLGHCQRCGYNLTGNVSGRCPECGANTTPVMLKTSRYAHVLKWIGLVVFGMTVLLGMVNCIVSFDYAPSSVLWSLIPVMIIGIPTIFLWRQNRMPPQGHCGKCGYNLTGNVSGTCPECGAKVPAP